MSRVITQNFNIGDSFMGSLVSMRSLTVGPLAVNCYLLYDLDSHKGIVVDPGGDGELIVSLVNKLGLKIEYILNTHGHCDHSAANVHVRDKTGAQLGIHEDDAYFLSDPDKNGANSMRIQYIPHKADFFIEDKEFIDVGCMRVWVMHTPGHSPGSCCFFIENLGYGKPALFSGDTLFSRSIGRTDLPGGSYDTIMDSLTFLVKQIPGESVVFPGHGPSTVFVEEKEHNPFFANIGEFRV
jgi:hydroxyacylglutathione hydrolase